ncbi:hypothetical protein ALNOE001_14940 [Candidatus Methanobinarius endosymbioticus]|uniref:Uncharacterized protein n=1 Tax=Candidatus Methanobinarius endosymbioticus TaxID=2006182 RepID=A0A366M991_9EURY|nr:hypothetical protein ALNOE001_14940 [Candidatus Methanobinarius endosymbioticus]
MNDTKIKYENLTSIDLKNNFIKHVDKLVSGLSKTTEENINLKNELESEKL